MIDYLETRPDVDATRVGCRESAWADTACREPRAERRIKAAFMSSGSYDLRSDLFEYYPPIQERVRWIIGAKDLADARKQLDDYNLGEGRAEKIEAPMLIGYSKDDRIMDPAGALRLYEAAKNSKRDMVEGTGHVQAANAGVRASRPVVFPDWAAKTLGADV